MRTIRRGREVYLVRSFFNKKCFNACGALDSYPNTLGFTNIRLLRFFDIESLRGYRGRLLRCVLVKFVTGYQHRYGQDEKHKAVNLFHIAMAPLVYDRERRKLLELR